MLLIIRLQKDYRLILELYSYSLYNRNIQSISTLVFTIYLYISTSFKLNLLTLFLSILGLIQARSRLLKHSLYSIYSFNQVALIISFYYQTISLLLFNLAIVSAATIYSLVVTSTISNKRGAVTGKDLGVFEIGKDQILISRQDSILILFYNASSYLTSTIHSSYSCLQYYIYRPRIDSTNSIVITSIGPKLKASSNKGRVITSKGSIRSSTKYIRLYILYYSYN